MSDPFTPQRPVVTAYPKMPAAFAEAEAIAAYLNEKGQEAPSGSLYEEGLRKRIKNGEFDLLIAVGGDGTMLRAGHLCAPCGVPILGINLGKLGFLIQVQQNEWRDMFERLFNGEAWIENRMMLRVEHVRAGEVLGAAGVQGNGQTELVEVLTGLCPATDGTVRILGQDVTNARPRDITELGVAHIPEDRQRDGLVLSFPIYDNLILQTYYEPPFAERASLQFEQVYEYAGRVSEEFDVRTPSIALPAQNLSGGNQQKVIVGREFSRPIQLLIAAQPTRGLDVGSIEYIHRRLVQKRDEGVAVLLVSVELDEIMALSDRIAVMYEGKIVGTVDADKISREELGLLMAGAQLEEKGGESVG